MKRKKFVVDRELLDLATFRNWHHSEIQVFSEQDFKEANNGRFIVNTRYCFHDWLKDIVKIVGRRTGGKKCFCEVDGVLYFNQRGWDALTKYLIAKNFLRPEDDANDGGRI